MLPSAPIVAYPALTCAILLTMSNVFMTFAWYAHLKNLRAKPLMIAVLASWGLAFFEYLLQVPANRIGFTVLQLPQLKILQEVITLAVFVPFAVLHLSRRGIAQSATTLRFSEFNRSCFCAVGRRLDVFSQAAAA